MRDMVLYGVLRLALWAVIWWLLTLADMGVALAGVLAALIAMLISILALNRLRDSAAMRWKEADERRRERRGPSVDEDADEEDSLLDRDDQDDRDDRDDQDDRGDQDDQDDRDDRDTAEEDDALPDEDVAEKDAVLDRDVASKDSPVEGDGASAPRAQGQADGESEASRSGPADLPSSAMPADEEQEPITRPDR